MKNMYKLLLLGGIAISIRANAQMINMNTDPNGEPWWAGGAYA